MAERKVRKVRMEGFFIEAKFSGYSDKVTWTIKGQSPKAKGYDYNLEFEVGMNFSELFCVAQEARRMVDEYSAYHERQAQYVEKALEGR